MAKVILMTQAEYAKHRGCSAVAVHKAVKAGRISLIGDRIDPAVADIQWSANTRARQPNRAGTGDRQDGPAETDQGDLVASPTPDPSAAPATPPAQTAPADTGYSAARARRERAEAEEAEIRTAKMRGDLVARDDIERAMFEATREMRDRLMAAGRRIGAEVATLTTAAECETALDREHRIVLELLATSFRERAGIRSRAE